MLGWGSPAIAVTWCSPSIPGLPASVLPRSPLSGIDMFPGVPIHNTSSHVELGRSGQHAILQGPAVRVAFDSGSVLVVIQVFERNIVFGHFARFDFRDIGRFGSFNALNHFGFEGIALVDQFLNALRIRVSNI